MKNIFCMKWGTKFLPSYVNTLAAMVRRHLAPPYRFVCFTEDGRDLDASIEVRPLPEMTLEQSLPERGWRKLTILGNSLGDDLSGPALFLDLDVVILDDLQPFFDQEGQFIIIHEKYGLRDPIIGNSSVFRFEIGEHQDVLDHFVKHGEEVRQQYRNEQAYLSRAIYQKGMLSYWDKTWCRSFKHHCLQPFPFCHFVPPKKPEGAKIVVFHGDPNPDEVQAGWIGRCGLRAARPADWIAENWRIENQSLD